ncbi:MAG: Phytochrome-like protein cph2 [Frankiales bacterium]|nr:Phytochrome-like protein cph2 [Frankiales bacterium]
MATSGTSAQRLFVLYAAVSLVPVIGLGAVLAQQAVSHGDARGLATARAEATLVAEGVIAPALGEAPLTPGMTPQLSAVQRSVGAQVRDGQVLRLRLRDLAANVIYSSDGSTTKEKDEALEAAHGKPVSLLSRLDADNGGAGPRVAEVYQPLRSTASNRLIGVVEIYLPYAPIAADIQQQRTAQLRTLGVGLLLLWLALLAVSASATRRLRRSAQQNAFLATHDALTELPNREAFLELAADAISNGPCAIAILDLDRFKEVNDALGHSIGDRLLRVLADRLATLAGDDAVVARLGGDEFGLVLPGGLEVTTTARLAGLGTALSTPVVLDGLPIGTEGSMGFALMPADGAEPEVLLAKAEVAMYAAKRRRLGPTRHRPELDEYDETRLRLLGELDDAIVAGQLVLHFQPKADAATGQIVSLEALVRWQHPERGLLYPDAFLIAAEQTGLIDRLTAWVLSEALAAITRLDPGGSLSVAVNVSARNLVRHGFASEVLVALLTKGVPASRLIVEMTETALLTDPGRAEAALRALADAGVRISIDDFGAGQTSLGYLATLPVHELKIDRVFVQGMETEPRSAAIARSIIELAHNLGFEVVAEGVETGAVMALLAEAGCDLVQGYYLARPESEAAMAVRLRDGAGAGAGASN